MPPLAVELPVAPVAFRNVYVVQVLNSQFKAIGLEGASRDTRKAKACELVEPAGDFFVFDCQVPAEELLRIGPACGDTFPTPSEFHRFHLVASRQSKKHRLG